MRQSLTIVIAVVMIFGIAVTTLAFGSYLGLGMTWSWHMNNGAGANTTQSMSMADAVQAFTNYLDRLHNTNLALHEVEEYQYNFYASYSERDTGRFAFQLLIWKPGASGMGGGMMQSGGGMMTGIVMPEPGPNMMWNAKYNAGMMNSMGSSGMMGGGGMMGGQGPGTTANMTVSPEQAQATAQQYLDNDLPGKTTGDADSYYGYYTIDVLLNGSTFGMISINGYTGQAWYHTWHGAYVQTKTLG